MTSKYHKKEQDAKKTKKQRQEGGFLNRYDFAYAGRDVINQAFKNLNASAPNLVKNLSNQEGKQLERIGLKLLRSTIEDAYKTPFRLLGQFGKKELAEVRQKLNKQLKKYA